MIFRRTALSLVLVGASVWCTGLVRQAYSEQRQQSDPPAASAPVTAVKQDETPDHHPAEPCPEDPVEAVPAG